MEFKILQQMFEGEYPDSVFEMGSAVGGLLLDIQRENPILKVGGIDTHKGDNETIKKIFPGEEFLLRDAWQIPWPIPDNSYDIVFTVGFFTVIKNRPHKVIKEMMRIAKDKIILAENNGEYNQQEFDGKIRVTRNYKQILDSLGFKYEILEGEGSKTIFKCNKK